MARARTRALRPAAIVSAAVLISQTISRMLPFGSRQMAWCATRLSSWNLKSQTRPPFQSNSWTRPPWPAPPKSRSRLSSVAAQEEMAVLEEVRLLACGVPAFPNADDPPLHVDQEGLLRVQRRHQGIALEGLRVVKLEAELGGALCFGIASPFFGAGASSGAATTATVAMVTAAVATTTTTRRQIRSGPNLMRVTPPGNASKGC